MTRSGEGLCTFYNTYKSKSVLISLTATLTIPTITTSNKIKASKAVSKNKTSLVTSKPTRPKAKVVNNSPTKATHWPTKSLKKIYGVAFLKRLFRGHVST